MSGQDLKAPTKPIIYPDSDGKPMADNTKQFEWIVTLVDGLKALFADNHAVFVAGDLLWYPVQGDNKTRIAPDALVAFGRPKGHRGSYKQWEEGGVAPQVVFEVLSPGNTPREMANKLAFYDRYGVEEYYLYDPDTGHLQGWWRQGERLVEIPWIRGWTSPRLGLQFDLDGMDLCLTRPDGRRFTSYVELMRWGESAQQRANQEAQRANQEAQRAANAEQRIEQEKQRAEQEKQRAEQEKQRAAAAESELARLRDLLKQRGIDPAG
ncbi:MAG TPA: Uma2 family endonuclease [Candidatus Competibacteraceae bacterium]|nr:Uma2 family endonuclease [Candidatus Competibacteraceae bacterium]